MSRWFIKSGDYYHSYKTVMDEHNINPKKKEDQNLISEALSEASKDPYKAYSMLKNKVIDKNDKFNFDLLLNTVKQNDHLFKKLITENIITLKDGDLFKDLIKNISDPTVAYDLIKDNKELFKSKDGNTLSPESLHLLKLALSDDKTASKVAYLLLNVDNIVSKQDILNLLLNDSITRENKEVFPYLVTELSGSDGAYELILNNKVTDQDGKLFYDLLDSIIYIPNAYDLIINNKIQNKYLYEKALISAIDDGYAVELLNDKIITKRNKKMFDLAIKDVQEDGLEDELNSGII